MKAKQTNEHWDIVVDASKNKSTTTIGELWRYRDLALLFAKRDFSTIYYQTILGSLWFFIQPLITMLFLTVVFHTIAGVTTDNLPADLFYLSGLTVWNYFSLCLSTTSNVLIINQYILSKVYFPKFVLHISKVLSALFVFCAQFILFILFLLFHIIVLKMPFHFSIHLLLLPFLVLLTGGLGMGLGLLISVLTVKYRDFIYLITYGLQLLMYLSPVIIPVSLMTGKRSILVFSNPVSAVIEDFRQAFSPPGPFTGCIWYIALYL